MYTILYCIALRYVLCILFVKKYLQIMDDIFFLPRKINVHYSNSATVFCVWGVLGCVGVGVCVYFICFIVCIRSLSNDFILAL